MTSPGWYPDPEDPNWLQFFDGQRWTGERYPAQSAQSAQPARARRKRLPLILGLVVVLVAGLLTGGYFLFLRGDSPKFTYNGKAVDQPAKALDQARAAVEAMVNDRHGVKSGDTRCYYAVPTKPAKGTKKTDVDQTIWCGPVLFVDGSAQRQYLRFTVSSAAADGGKVTLTPGSGPVDREPSALPSGFTLKRPDGASPPSGAGGLSVPPPPAADKDTLTVADIGDQNVPAAPADAVIGSINGGIRLTNVGPVDRYGRGDDARTPPVGQKLIAFKLGPGFNNDGDVRDLSSAASVVVDGGTPRKLPSGDGYRVVAVPTGAKTVDLVLADGGYTQTLSLLTGKPGAQNVTVLARTHRESQVNKTLTAAFTFSPTVVFADGTSGTSESATVTVKDAYLYFDLASRKVRPSKPGNALLYVDISYVEQHNAGQQFGFPPDVLKFTPNGGAPIAARNVATEANKLYNVFEVPGGLTGGTLTIAGSYTEKFNNSNNSYTTTVASLSVPISFPAG